MESLDTILERCAAVCGVSVGEIRQARKRCTRRVADAKQLFVYCALLDNCYRKKKDLADALCVGAYQVTHYRKKAEFSIGHERWFQELVKKYQRMKEASV